MSYKCIALVPVFNRKNKLNNFFENALKVKDFFWLIVDDNSTDGTKERVKEYQKRSDAIGYINTNDGNLFWGGTLNFALQNLDTIKQQYGLNELTYYAFVNDDIAYDAYEINSAFPNFDEKAIYSATAYRKGKYVCGFKIDNQIKEQKFNQLPASNVKVNTVGGYMVFYPIDLRCEFSKFTIHHQADVSYCYTIAQKYNAKVLTTPKIVLNIDDSDKVFMAKMSLKEYLYSSKSPYEFKANMYYFLLISKDVSMFFRLLGDYFYRLVRSKVYYKIKFWNE